MNDSLSTPTLPTVHRLPLYLAEECAAAYWISKAFKANTHRTMMVFALRCLSHTLSFVITDKIDSVFSDDPNRELRVHKIFFWTSAVTNILFVVALRELQLIGNIFSMVLGIGVAGILIRRLIHIESQENALVLQSQ